MSVVWIPITERTPPSNVWCHIRTTEWRVENGYCIAQLSNGYWWNPKYGYISGVTHWAELEN